MTSARVDHAYAIFLSSNLVPKPGLSWIFPHNERAQVFIGIDNLVPRSLVDEARLRLRPAGNEITGIEARHRVRPQEIWERDYWDRSSTSSKVP